MAEKLICLLGPNVSDWEAAPFITLLKPLHSRESAEWLHLKSGLPSPNFLKQFDRFWIVAKSTEEIGPIIKKISPSKKVFISLLSLEKEKKRFGVMRLFSTSSYNAHYLAHSELSFRFLKEVQKQAQVSYLPLPIPEVGEVHKEKNKERFVVGTLGWFSSSFNLNYFLLVAHYVLQQRKNIWFRLLGDGPLKKHAQKLIAELNLSQAVEICDFVEAEEMSAIDLFVFAPLRNDNDISLLWPAAFSIPVLGAQVPGIENFITDGKTGFLVPVHETKPMAELILRFLDHEPLRAAFGSAYREKLSQELTPELLTRKVESLLA